ncbi:MAG: starch-binding protein [Ruminococcus sp.]|nr:starch-binding protein [Ruminococcus sp.]
MKRLTSILLCAALILTAGFSLVSCSGGESTNTDYNLTKNISDGAILHCFCWDFKTITNSLDDIAAAGYSTIQTSPINECLVGESGGMQLYGDGKWYYHFQPTDYKIGNYQLGTRDEFKTMCKKADELGIKVIVDVVANHTTPTTSALNQNLLDAVGGIDKLYHKNNDKDISNWGDRLQCTTYKMGGLPDINTENKAYQDYFISFINDCIECGADGFRYDAAKHIALPDDPTETDGVENNFWTRVTKEIKNADKIFNYGEVLQGDNDRIGDYINTIGACTASSYGSKIRSAVMQCDVDTAYVEDLKVGSNESCVTWVESHDNYINDGNWSAMDDELVIDGWAIIAARAKGTPLFFDRPYGCSTDNQWGTMNRIGTSGDMFYKDKRVTAVNFFRNAMVGEEENITNPDEDSTSVQICRGNKGAVIVNTAKELKVDFETSLADGTYTDRVDNKTVYTVKDGKLSCDTPIPEYGVVVLYNEGYTEYAAPATVKISDKVSCLYDSETIEVPLEVKNADEGTYSVNDGKETKYKDGDKVTLKASDATDGVITLTLKTESKAGQKTYMKYYFTNANITGTDTTRYVEKGDKVTFEKPEGWGDTLYAYVYDDSDGQEKPWPGTEMKKLGDGKYEHSFLYDWENPFIIFSDGENQYPGKNEQGLPAEKDSDFKME